jgi:hypothetical protein
MDFIFSYQAAQEHIIQDITLDKVFAEGFQAIVQGLNVQCDDVRGTLLSEISDQPVTNFPVGSRN